MLTRRKKIIFSLLPALLLVVLLALAELLMRVFSPRSPGALVTEARYDGIEWYSVNRGALEKYFPAGTPIVPELKPAIFRKSKTPGALRVMCLGESSMFGTPYEMTATIPGILRKQLRHLLPGTEIEVVNWGASAINTNVIADLSGQIATFEPDAVVLYAGHNEFYGPDGIGASFLERQIPFLTRLKYAARELRLVGLIQSLLKRGTSSRTAAAGEESNLMRQVSQGSQVGLESRESERIFRMFETNLLDIVEVFRAKGIRVILSDVSSNLLFPPFESDSVRLPGSWGTLRDEFTRGRYTELMQAGRRLLRNDSSNAALNYWVGRSCLALGDTVQAKSCLEKARDNDLLKFRAPSRINGIIRSVALREGCTFFAADSLLGSLSPGGIPGDKVFWEHLHPNAYGYYSIASSIAGILAGMLKPPAEAPLLPFQTDSLSIPWLDLAYADLSMQHLTSKWPFQDYPVKTAVLESADPALRRIVDDVYARRTGWDEGCYKCASLFWSRGEFRQARTTYEALLEEYPYQYYSRYLLGSLLNHTGHMDEAIGEYRVSIRSNPSYLQARLDLGLIEVNRGNFDEAERQLDTVLKGNGGTALTPDLRSTALYGMAAVWANRGDLSKSITLLDEALRLHPGYEDALRMREKIVSSMPK